MKLYQLIAISLSTLTLYSCSGTPVRRSVVNPLPRESASWHKSESFKGDDALFPKQVISSKYDVRKPDKVTAAQLDLIFRGKLEGKGAKVIEVSKKYGICPKFYSALLCHESAFGTSAFARKYNNVAGRMAKGGRQPMKFSSVDECLDSSAKHLQKNYVLENRVTLAAIQKKYCPIGAKNDPKGKNRDWLSGLQSLMERI